MTAVDLCCGYGGASAGLLAAGVTISASYDLDPVAVAAHQRWHPDTPCAIRNVSSILPDELEGHFVWASLPCQPWSNANRSKMRGHEHRAYYSLAYLAHQVQLARVTVLENVEGLVTSAEGRREVEALACACQRLGLSLLVRVVPAFWYGVAQHRRRAIFVIGAPVGPLGGPLIEFGPTGAPVGPLQDAVRATFGGGVDTPEYRRGRTDSKLHRSPLATDGKGGRTRNRLHPAIVASGGKSGNGRDHPGTRTAEEAAALQHLPFEHLEGLSKTAQHRLIGNAVPPPMAEGIVRAVLAAV